MRKRRIGNRVAKAEPSAGVFRVAEDCTGTSVACVQGVKCECDEGESANVCMTLADVQFAGGTVVQKVDGVCYEFDEDNEVACKTCGFVASPSEAFEDCADCCEHDPPECCVEGQCYVTPFTPSSPKTINYDVSLVVTHRICCPGGQIQIVTLPPFVLSQQSTGTVNGLPFVDSLYNTPCQTWEESGIVDTQVCVNTSGCVPFGPQFPYCLTFRYATRWNSDGTVAFFVSVFPSGGGTSLSADTVVGGCGVAIAAISGSLTETCQGQSYTSLEISGTVTATFPDRYPCGSMAASSQSSSTSAGLVSGQSSGCSGCGKGEQGVVFQ